MSAFFDAQCEKCGKRFGWYGTVVARPPCPKCNHSLSKEILEEANKEIEEFRKILLKKSEKEKYQKEKTHNHTCHAYMCSIIVQPEMFMCKKHWKMLSTDYKNLIWKHYRVGQCDDKKITKEYANTAKMCIRYIAIKEDLVIPNNHPCLVLYDFCTVKQEKS